MLLTIGIPTKNSEKHIMYALKSIARQILPKDLEIEIVIVDGNSNDKTLEYIKKGFHIIKESLGTKLTETKVLFENVGRIGYARNMIVMNSQGDWILWLDSDNVIEEYYIWKFWHMIHGSETGVAVIYPSRVIFIGKNFMSKAIACYLYSTLPKVNVDLHEEEQLPVTAMQGVFTRRSDILDIGGFDNRLKAGEDIDLFLKLKQKEYIFKQFNGKLYAFTKDSLRSWLHQAIIWDYYKTIIQQTYSIERRVNGKIDLYQDLFRIFENYIISAVYGGRWCNASQILLTPLLFILRKLSFYLGKRLALYDYNRGYLR